MVVDMATLPVMIHSFLSDSLHAPVPDPSKPDSNLSRKLYKAYLQRAATVSAYTGEKRIIDMTFM